MPEDISRRDFLKEFLPLSSENQESENQEPAQEAFPQKNENIEKDNKEEKIIISRKNFLKFIVGASLSIGFAGGIKGEIEGNNENHEKHEKPLTLKERAEEDTQEAKKELSDFMERISSEEMKDSSYAETVVEQGLMMLAKKTANEIFEKLEIDHGNKGITQEDLIKYLKEKPLTTLFRSGILHPILEEAIFRALPVDKLIDKTDRRKRWDIGIPVSALFAFSHNFRNGENFGDLELYKSVPVSQFMGGLFYWYLMREKGFSHATMAHSMNNAVPESLGAIFLKLFPGEKGEEMAKKIL